MEKSPSDPPSSAVPAAGEKAKARNDRLLAASRASYDSTGRGTPRGARKTPTRSTEDSRLSAKSMTHRSAQESSEQSSSEGVTISSLSFESRDWRRGQDRFHSKSHNNPTGNYSSSDSELGVEEEANDEHHQSKRKKPARREGSSSDSDNTLSSLSGDSKAKSSQNSNQTESNAEKDGKAGSESGSCSSFSEEHGKITREDLSPSVSGDEDSRHGHQDKTKDTSKELLGGKAPLPLRKRPFEPQVGDYSDLKAKKIGEPLRSFTVNAVSESDGDKNRGSDSNDSAKAPSESNNSDSGAKGTSENSDSGVKAASESNSNSDSGGNKAGFESSSASGNKASSESNSDSGHKASSESNSDSGHKASSESNWDSGNKETSESNSDSGDNRAASESNSDSGENKVTAPLDSAEKSSHLKRSDFLLPPPPRKPRSEGPREGKKPPPYATQQQQPFRKSHSVTESEATEQKDTKSATKPPPLGISFRGGLDALAGLASLAQPKVEAPAGGQRQPQNLTVASMEEHNAAPSSSPPSSMGGGMTDIEAKRAYNRKNAARARERTKKRMEELQERVSKLRTETDALKASNTELEMKLSQLTADNQELVQSHGRLKRAGAAHGVAENRISRQVPAASMPAPTPMPTNTTTTTRSSRKPSVAPKKRKYTATVEAPAHTAPPAATHRVQAPKKTAQANVFAPGPAVVVGAVPSVAPRSSAVAPQPQQHATSTGVTQELLGQLVAALERPDIDPVYKQQAIQQILDMARNDPQLMAALMQTMNGAHR